MHVLQKCPQKFPENFQKLLHLQKANHSTKKVWKFQEESQM